jgi:hypothetical protein
MKLSSVLRSDAGSILNGTWQRDFLPPIFYIYDFFAFLKTTTSLRNYAQFVQQCDQVNATRIVFIGELQLSVLFLHVVDFLLQR